MERAAISRGILFLIILSGCGAAVLSTNYDKKADVLVDEGYVPSSPLVKEKLLKGEKLVMATELKAGKCYAFLAAKDKAGAALHFSVWRWKKEVEQRVEKNKLFAVIYYCSLVDDRYTLNVSVEGEDSGVLVGVWTKKGEFSAGGGKPGSCDDPFELETGKEIQGSTESMSHMLQGPCIQGKAPEAVYRVDIGEVSHFSAELDADFDGGLYLLDRCSIEGEAIACNDDFQMKSGKSRIGVLLDPGVYYLVVDGFGVMKGDYKLESSIISFKNIDTLCDDAPLLQAGKEASGDTADKLDTFHGSCAQGAKGPDQIYRVEIEEPSRTRFLLRTPDFDGVLHLHKGCPGESVEMGCNDDFTDNKSSMILVDLQPGIYTVVVDGYDGAEAGAYSLRMETFSESTQASDDDKCQDAVSIAGISDAKDQSVAVEGSLFWAEDDVQPACAASPGGPDIFRKFKLDSPSMVSIGIQSTHFPGIVVALLEGCGGKELACQLEGLETRLPAGDYILVVDSLGADQVGDFALEMRIQDLHALEKVCSGGGKLEDGKLVEGKTDGKGSFAGSCGGLGYGPENVHVLKLKKKSKVRIEVNPEGFDSVIYIRKKCMEKTSESACNDDAGSIEQSVIEATLEKGTYYVFVDGCKETDSGHYTIRAIIK